jgi:RNA polymerase subunit RPABC4/transcription elongation factor Spt4
MKYYRFKKRLNCSHGVSKDEICPTCKSDNVYIQKDIESLAKRYNKRKPNNFALAFDLKEKFNYWRKIYQINSFGYYLHELEEIGNLKFKPNTLKHAYYVARAFPDLENEDKRKLCFSAYSEIANSRLSREEKKKEREKAEETENVTVNQIRNIIAKKLKDRTIKERFRYDNNEKFLKEIDSFVKENINHFNSDPEIIVSIKPRKPYQKTTISILLEDDSGKDLPDGDRI